MLSTSVVVLDFETTGLAPRAESPPDLCSYKLAAVADHLGVRFAGSAHRAEADARVAVDVLLKLAGRVAADHSIAAVDPDLLRRVTRWSAREAPTRLRRALQNRLVRPRVSDDLAHGVFRDNRAGVTRTTSTVKPLIPKRHETQRPPELDRAYQGRRWRFDRRL